jgi:hypothetical protein
MHDATPPPQRPVPRWTGLFFWLLGVGTVPWVFYLAATLPRRQPTVHYDIAWIGFDIALIAMLMVTGWLAYKGSDVVELPAAITAALLFMDAWFDVLTSATKEQLLVAVVLAVGAEIPGGLACLILAGHAERVRQRRQTFLRRRLRRLDERLAGYRADRTGSDAGSDGGSDGTVDATGSAAGGEPAPDRPRDLAPYRTPPSTTTHPTS